MGPRQVRDKAMKPVILIVDASPVGEARIIMAEQRNSYH